MTTFYDIKHQVYTAILSLIDDKSTVIKDDLRLIGGGGALDSMKLLELCLILEDQAAEMGFEFDWTSAAAMSMSRSMFRTALSLATEFYDQYRLKQ